MKRYELKKTAEGGLLYVEEADILAVRRRKGDAATPVEIELRNREAYRPEDGFRFNPRAQTVILGLSLRQARELIEQDRAEHGKAFCETCFDFGASADPEECARCRVILALHKAGQGDLRKVRIPLPEIRSNALPVAFALLLVVYWWTLCQWTTAASERDQARQELARVQRRIK